MKTSICLHWLPEGEEVAFSCRGVEKGEGGESFFLKKEKCQQVKHDGSVWQCVVCVCDKDNHHNADGSCLRVVGFQVTSISLTFKYCLNFSQWRCIIHKTKGRRKRENHFHWSKTYLSDLEGHSDLQSPSPALHCARCVPFLILVAKLQGMGIQGLIKVVACLASYRLLASLEDKICPQI